MLILSLRKLVLEVEVVLVAEVLVLLDNRDMLELHSTAGIVRKQPFVDRIVVHLLLDLDWQLLEHHPAGKDKHYSHELQLK